MRNERSSGSYTYFCRINRHIAQFCLTQCHYHEMRGNDLPINVYFWLHSPFFTYSLVTPHKLSNSTHAGSKIAKHEIKVCFRSILRHWANKNCGAGRSISLIKSPFTMSSLTFISSKTWVKWVAGFNVKETGWKVMEASRCTSPIAFIKSFIQSPVTTLTQQYGCRVRMFEAEGSARVFCNLLN